MSRAGPESHNDSADRLLPRVDDLAAHRDHGGLGRPRGATGADPEQGDEQTARQKKWPASHGRYQSLASGTPSRGSMAAVQVTCEMLGAALRTLPSPSATFMVLWAVCARQLSQQVGHLPRPGCTWNISVLPCPYQSRPKV